jgi:predicted PurR-regulated permease PerM
MENPAGRFRKPMSRDLVETVLVVLLFIGLIYSLYHVLQVFFGVLTFALIFSVSFHRPYEHLAKAFKGKRKLAAVVYSLLLISMIAVPLIFLIGAMSRHLKELGPLLSDIKAHGLPPLPASVINIPYLGSEISAFWCDLRSSPRDTLRLHEHQIQTILHHVITGGLGVLGVGVQVILGIAISGIFLERGDNLLLPVRSTIKHLVSDSEGDNLLAAITQAIRGVSIGVMGTGFIAAFISWTGLVIAGIPFAGGLAALIFFLVVIQIGSLVVWIPLIIWAIIQGNHAVTIILVVYLVVIFLVDIFIKPLLIAKSGKLPFLVLFLGVIGGLAAWGFTGMFKGAIITSLFYTIFNAWLERKSFRTEEISDNLR